MISCTVSQMFDWVQHFYPSIKSFHRTYDRQMLFDGVKSIVVGCKLSLPPQKSCLLQLEMEILSMSVVFKRCIRCFGIVPTAPITLFAFFFLLHFISISRSLYFVVFSSYFVLYFTFSKYYLIYYADLIFLWTMVRSGVLCGNCLFV